jgi:hypothetical protein
MEADLIFFVDAPTPEMAAKIARETVGDFKSMRQGVIQSVKELTWIPRDSVMEVPIVVGCNSREHAFAVNEELKNLFAKHQRANGVNARKMGSLAVSSKPSQKRWWQLWR